MRSSSDKHALGLSVPGRQGSEVGPLIVSLPPDNTRNTLPGMIVTLRTAMGVAMYVGPIAIVALSDANG